MKIGICDDEPICIQQLEHIIIENFNDVDIVTYWYQWKVITNH